MPQQQKKIILGVSSSIACYKACELIRLLQKQGCAVHVVMSPNATKLVTPVTFGALSGYPVHYDSFGERKNGMHHVALATGADLLLAAPATANLIGKMACGIADDLLSTTFLSVRSPVVVAPAMHPAMWQNPAVQENVATLQRRGVHFIAPECGPVASGDEGQGRLAEPSVIVSAVLALLDQIKVNAANVT